MCRLAFELHSVYMVFTMLLLLLLLLLSCLW
jgi:hypothetical protein